MRPEAACLWEASRAPARIRPPPDETPRVARPREVRAAEPKRNYWIFYRDNLDGSRSAVFCFFVLMNF
jgi:hypothetical protein